MFNRIVQQSLKYRIAVIVLYIIISIAGIWSVMNLPVDVLPDLNRPRVTVFAEAEWLGAEEVEKLVSMPLERVFANIPGVEAVRSSSALELAVINIEFAWGTNINLARQRVNERLLATQLPEGVHSTMAPQTALLGEVLWVWLTATGNITQAQLRWIAESTLRQSLISIPWVANLLIMWWTPKQYNILLNPQQMVNRWIELDAIESALAFITTPAWWWVILQPNIEYPVSLQAFEGDINTLWLIVIGHGKNWDKVLLNDIAKITEWSNLQRRGDAIIDGQAWVIIRISKIANANTLELTEQIQTTINNLEMPKWVIIHSSLFKQADFINKWLWNVKSAFLEAIVIVAIIIVLFLMNVRAVLITLLSLPITLLLSALVFKLIGIEINIMILWWLTIAIGELVDDAIVDMENIFRRLKENYLKPISQQKSWFSVVYHASIEVRGSVIYATLLQVIVFVPFLLLPWLDGKLLAPIAIWYMISLFSSLIVWITFVPLLCSYILPNWIKKKYRKKYPELYSDNAKAFADNKIESIIHREEDTWLTKRLKALIEKPVKRSLRYPYRALWIALLTLPLTLWMYQLMEKEWLPAFNETSFTIGITTKPWSSLDYTINVAKQITSEISLINWVKSTATILWRADADAHAQWSNAAESEVDLGIEITNDKKNEIYNQINEIIKKYKNLAVITVWQPITHRVEELISWIRAPLVIKLYGTDLDELEKLGKEILAKIETVPWVLNPSLEPQTKVPSINIEPNIINQSAYGIPYNTVKNMIEVGVWGKEVSQVIDNQLRYPVVLMYDSPRRWSVQALWSIPLQNIEWQLFTLWSLATITTTKSRNMINHENGQRRIVIQWFTQWRWIVDVVDDIKKELIAIKMPAWYRVSYEWLYQAQQESSRVLIIVLFFVVFGIAWILYWHFWTMRIVVQVMLDILTWWFGGMIGVWLSGWVLSTAHLVWFISLMGIVSRNAILLIDHYKHLYEVEWVPWWEELIIRWSRERIVPVAMTALSAILWLLPLVLNAWDTWKEILAPIAIVVFWGLFVSTVIEFLIRPWIFYKFNTKMFGKEKNT